MTAASYLLAVIAVLCLAEQISAAKPKIVKTFTHEPHKLVLTESSAGGYLTYTVCDAKCRVVYSEIDYANNSTKQHSCPVDITAEELKKVIAENFNVAPWTNHKAIFQYVVASKIGDSEILNNATVKVKVIDMYTCKTTDTDYFIPYKTEALTLQLVRFEDTFDVIIRSGVVASNHSSITFGSSGEVVKNLTNLNLPSLLAFNYFVPVDPRSPPAGYINLRFSLLDKLAISMIVNKEKKVYGEFDYKLDGLMKKVDYEYGFSYATNAHLIGLCYRHRELVNCSQYDLDGNRKLQLRTTSFDYPQEIFVEMYNLPGGGFLLLFVDCPKDLSVKKCLDSPTRRTRLVRFDENGSIVGATKYDDLGCDVSKEQYTAAFFEKNGQYCVSGYCYDENNDETKKIKQHVRCYNDADFAPLKK